eukprot:CAMPEP_0185280706 /NCGR_PEP_ID=MMETSP1359-20130426/66302_1 /TAXON_ID=552665 /ORGANISM="Bigelowiella longifila, Strain CCMP242" /LENGTH=53 /DNA_ID=CAMNT_0027876037 /DNA_START=1010 /DNA_END=1167 /DNA_ORIENTATION=+
MVSKLHSKNIGICMELCEAEERWSGSLSSIEAAGRSWDDPWRIVRGLSGVLWR